MPNDIQYVGIIAKDYNNRALINHNANTSPICQQSNGTLWAALRENWINNYISLYRSLDLGFSWERVWYGNFTDATNRKVGIPHLNQNGSWMSLTIHEQANRIILWHSYLNASTGLWDLEPFVWRITAPTIRITDANEVPSTNVISLSADFGAAITVANEGTAWIVNTFHNNLFIQQLHPTYTKLTEVTAQVNGTYFDVFHACADANGLVDVAILAAGPNYTLVHFRYDQNAGHFTIPGTIITTLSGQPDVADVCIAKDGNDSLLVVWGQKNLASTNIDTFASLSTDDGATWSTPIVVDRTSGHGPYRDKATAELSTRATCFAGDSGFLISYCNTNTLGVPKTFVRNVTTTDGVNYVVEDEAEIATKATGADESVCGLRWFPPAGARLTNLNDPGKVRVAYQIGEGNSTVQVSTTPIRIGQELLSDSAYPTTLPSESGSYTTMIPLPTQLPVSFNVIGGTYDNSDYYALGLIGTATKRFQAAFQRVSNEIRFLRYDPDQLSELNDRSAYGEATEFTSLGMMRVMTYEDPTANDGMEGFRQFIERDSRKIYVPADFHFSRQFVLNRGNFLKRTVWLTQFDGNYYEITQVVPHFLRDQLCYYSANAYVLGPANDPFSKSTLPSET